MIWQEVERTYGRGVQALQGKAVIFNIFYSGAKNKNDPNVYVLRCFLAGYKPIIGSFRSEEEAKQRAEKCFNKWLEFAGLQIK